MAKDAAREKFHQELLKLSRFKIRRACIDSGCAVNMVREAEQIGEEAMIELLMEKYDAGEVSQPGMATGKPKGGGSKTTRKAKRAEPEPEQEPEEPEELEEPEESESLDENDLWGSDDDDLNTEEPAEVPPPKKKAVARKAAREEEPVAEHSGLEDQITQLMDLQVTIAENVDSLNKTVTKLSKSVDVTQKYVVFVKEFVELTAGAAFKFLKQSKMPNPLKSALVVRQKAYEKSGLDAPKSDGSRKAKT